jgi:hypothetical protein
MKRFLAASAIGVVLVTLSSLSAVAEIARFLSSHGCPKAGG